MRRKTSLFLIFILTVSLMMPMRVLAEPENDQGGGQDQQQQQQQQEQGGNQDGGSSGDNGGSDSSGSSDADQNTGSGGSQDTGGSQDSGMQNQPDQGSGSGGSQNENAGQDQHANERTQDTGNNNNKDNKKQETRNDTNAGKTEGQKAKTENAEQSKNTISLIATGDIHSHLDGTKGKGGFARLKTKIDDIKEDYPESFIFDAGDFSMGTAFQTITRSEAPELKMMGELGYDAACIGNHDFDYGPVGTARMLRTASGAKEIKKNTTYEYDQNTRRRTAVTTYDQFMPSLLCANIDWDRTLKDKKLAKEAKVLKSAMDVYGVCDYTIVEKNGVKVAVFGVLGETAQTQSPYCGVIWQDPIERAGEIVSEIQRNEEADMIVCLSHSGYTEEEGSGSEDARLAKKVKGIDVIISGHEHEALTEPVKSGNTYIIASGEYTEHVSNLVLKKTRSGLELKEYKLYNLNKVVEKNEEIQSKVNAYKDIINDKYFSGYGFTYGQILANCRSAFPTLDEFEQDRQDNALGNLIADSFIYAVKKAEGSKYENVDVAVMPAGQVKASLGKGGITTAEVFSVCSMGRGADDRAGYPLVSFYVTGKELKRLVEIDASFSKRSTSNVLHVSGMSYGFNDRRLLLNRAVDISLEVDEKKKKIKNSELYRVVTGIKTMQIFENVDKRSRGLLAVIPKDKDGNEITDYDKCIIKKDGKELKEWYALAGYLQSLSANEMSEKYSAPQGRLRNVTSIAPWAIIKQPNNYGVMLLAMIMIPIVIAIGLIIYIRQRIYQKRGYEKTMFGEGHRKRRSLLKSRRMGISGGQRNRY